MSLDARIARLEERAGIHPPEINRKSDEEILREMESIWEETSKEIPGWVNRLRSGEARIEKYQVGWSFVDREGKSCLYDLHGALFAYFEGWKSGGEKLPHAAEGEGEPSTEKEIADLVENHFDDFCFLITTSRYMVRASRVRLGFPPVPDWWKN